MAKWFVNRVVRPDFATRSLAAILLYVREHGEVGVAEVEGHFMDWRNPSDNGPIEPRLDQLRRAKLIVTSSRTREGHTEKTVKVSPTLSAIQAALRFSLPELVKFPPNDSMPIAPTFGLPEQPSIVPDIFVAMPLAESFRPIYEAHIRPVAERLGLIITRADDVFGGSAIVQDIWSLLNASRLVIADCTDRNPNVF